MLYIIHICSLKIKRNPAVSVSDTREKPPQTTFRDLGRLRRKPIYNLRDSAPLSLPEQLGRQDAPRRRHIVLEGGGPGLRRSLYGVTAVLLGIPLPHRGLGALLRIPLGRRRRHPRRIPSGSLGSGRLALDGLGICLNSSGSLVPITEGLVHIHGDAA